ncbi:MAG TPA: GIY-YIG nuclease family protein [Gemmatimonadales bacterium]|nr:GIY-YIG nuclease family protein [Gemmatimonadales bacterium]
MTALALSLTDLNQLRRRVIALAENRPAIYRMTDQTGRVIYVGKAKRLRVRLLTYFRHAQRDEKAGRIARAAADIVWDYCPSEFAAALGELRQIKRYRPPFNVQMNRRYNVAFVKVSGDSTPKLFVSRSAGDDRMRFFGPFRGPSRLKESLRVLNDLLGLRDCALRMPVVSPGQGDLFGDRRAACMRYDFGTCTGPCAGLVSDQEYLRRVHTAVAFLESRSLAPLDHVIAEMAAASDQNAFERATWWRERFEALEWLLAAATRARVAVEMLTFVYTDPGAFGDERVYIIRNATVRASAPAPHTPIEREAFRALVAEHATAPLPATLNPSDLDEMLLLLAWFRRRPAALRRTVPLEAWH